jgi:preprotein translocase SecE subunit
MIQKFATYLRESVEELHLVRWPTRQQAVRLSVIVIIFCAVTSIVFGFIDSLLGQVIRFYLSFVS